MVPIASFLLNIIMQCLVPLQYVMMIIITLNIYLV